MTDLERELAEALLLANECSLACEGVDLPYWGGHFEGDSEKISAALEKAKRLLA